MSLWESDASFSKDDSQPFLNMNAQYDIGSMPKDVEDFFSTKTVLKNVPSQIK